MGWIFEGVPLVFGAVLSAAVSLGGDDGSTTVTVAYADSDVTAVSSLLAAARSTFIAYRLCAASLHQRDTAVGCDSDLISSHQPTQADRTEVRNMPNPKPEKARLPPRWFIRLAWITHRRLYRLTGGRLGLWRPKPGGWGTMRLTTIGRRTGRARL